MRLYDEKKYMQKWKTEAEKTGANVQSCRTQFGLDITSTGGDVEKEITAYHAYAKCMRI